MTGVLVVTRKQQLLEAFRRSGRRGLTAREMEQVVGMFWRLRLRELVDDGYRFAELRSRRQPSRVWRWALVSEPLEPGPVVDPQAVLFDPPASPPADAIGGLS